MNFDQRSKHLNTEIGLIIDSPELAQADGERVSIAWCNPPMPTPWRGARWAPGVPHLVWDSQENGNAVEYTREPARGEWQRLEQNLLSWLPIGREL